MEIDAILQSWGKHEERPAAVPGSTVITGSTSRSRTAADRCERGHPPIPPRREGKLYCPTCEPKPPTNEDIEKYLQATAEDMASYHAFQLVSQLAWCDVTLPAAKEALRDASGDAEQAASAIIEGFEA